MRGRLGGRGKGRGRVWVGVGVGVRVGYGFGSRGGAPRWRRSAAMTTITYYLLTYHFLLYSLTTDHAGGEALLAAHVRSEDLVVGRLQTRRDTGEMQGRYRRDVGEIQGRRVVRVW